MKSAPAIALAITLALALSIAVLTLMRVPVPAGVGGSDKTHHLLGFAALALPISAVRPRWIVGLAVVLAAYGGAIELIQPFVGRSRELADWLADLKGIAVGALAGLLANRLLGLLRTRPA